MTPIESKMREWLATGSEAERRHAADRIAVGFGPEPAPPPLLTRAVNFASAVVSHVAAGMPAADPETIAARLAVCNGPPEGPPCDQRLAGGTCAGCGCNLPLKASWLDQECPLGKWERPT